MTRCHKMAGGSKVGFQKVSLLIRKTLPLIIVINRVSLFKQSRSPQSKLFYSEIITYSMRTNLLYVCLPSSFILQISRFHICETFDITLI